MTDPRRPTLTEQEKTELRPVQEIGETLNTVDAAFFPRPDEACLFVEAPDGSGPLFVNLRLLGQWHADGSISGEELRKKILGPDASRAGKRIKPAGAGESRAETWQDWAGL